jgi:pimeloyl-ACP methyl ester carboxylesterase
MEPAMPLSRTAALARKVVPLHRLRERRSYVDGCRDAPGRFVDLPGGRCHYREAGSGQPVVLLHGFLYSTVMWDPVLEPLGREFRALSLDLFGWGYSSRHEGGHYDYQVYADQLRTFLDALGIERAALVGQSMGGGTIIRFAVQHPDRVERLVLVAAASLPNPPSLTARLFALPLVGEALMTAVPEITLERNLKKFWFRDPTLVTREYVERLGAPLRIRGSSWTALSILRTLDFGSQEALLGQLAELALPTLIVWGRDDAAVPLALGEQMHRMLPGSELLVLDDAGHTPHEEQPEAFLERVVPFLHGDAGAAGRE